MEFDAVRILKNDYKIKQTNHLDPELAPIALFLVENFTEPDAYQSCGSVEHDQQEKEAWRLEIAREAITSSQTADIELGEHARAA